MGDGSSCSSRPKYHPGNLTRLPPFLLNKVRNEEEAKFLEAETPGMPVFGYLPADLKVQEADRLNIPVYDDVPALKEAAARIVEKLANLQ